MSAYLYEEALIKQLREVIRDDRIHIIDPQLTSSFLAQVDSDKNDYPAIVLTRKSSNIVSELKNLPLMIRGDTSTVKGANLIQKVKVITIRIEWDINIYAADRYTCDEIVRELVFYFINHPRFYVDIPYNLNINQEFDIILDNNIEDNTDLVDFKNTGELFRETLSIYTDNAHFFSQGLLYPLSVDPEVTEDLDKGRKKPEQ